MPEESLLTPEVRALVGGAGDPVPFDITPRLVRRAMETLQDGGLPIPAHGEVVPGYVFIAGTSDEGRGAPSVPPLLPDTLMVGNEWRFERPLRMGDRLTITSRLASVTERMGGRFGYSIFVRNDAEYRDEAGALVGVAALTLMQYDARAATGDDES